MHDVVRKYSENGWGDFDDNLDDYETRNFAYQYELMGQFVRGGLVDKKTVMNALQGLVVINWRAFGPQAPSGPLQVEREPLAELRMARERDRSLHAGAGHVNLTSA